MVCSKSSSSATHDSSRCISAKLHNTQCAVFTQEDTSSRFRKCGSSSSSLRSASHSDEGICCTAKNLRGHISWYGFGSTDVFAEWAHAVVLCAKAVPSVCAVKLSTRTSPRMSRASAVQRLRAPREVSRLWAVKQYIVQDK